MKSINFNKGFTLFELMVAIALISILAGIVLVSLDSARANARSTWDLDQQRAFPKANTSFSYDNNGRLLHPCTTDSFDWLDGQDSNILLSQYFSRDKREADKGKLLNSGSRLWVDTNLTEVDEGGSRTCTLTELLNSSGNQNQSELDATLQVLDGNLPETNWRIERSDALTEGAAWDYLGELGAYKSPIDPTGRLRSYSLNSYVGVALCAEDYFPTAASSGEDFWPGLVGSSCISSSVLKNFLYSTETMSKILDPAKTLYSLGEEDQRNFITGVPGINFNGWVIPPVPSSYSCASWWNLPAAWESRGVNVSNVDGSVVLLKFEPKVMELISDAQFEDGILNVEQYPESEDAYELIRNKLLPKVFSK